MSYTREHPRIDYDSKYDVMNYIFGDTSNSYGDEDLDNIVTLKDIETDVVTGYTVLNFKKICQDKSEGYNELLHLFDVQKVLSLCN